MLAVPIVMLIGFIGHKDHADNNRTFNLPYKAGGIVSGGSTSVQQGAANVYATDDQNGVHNILQSELVETQSLNNNIWVGYTNPVSGQLMNWARVRKGEIWDTTRIYNSNFTTSIDEWTGHHTDLSISETTGGVKILAVGGGGGDFQHGAVKEERPSWADPVPSGDLLVPGRKYTVNGEYYLPSGAPNYDEIQITDVPNYEYQLLDIFLSKYSTRFLGIIYCRIYRARSASRRRYFGDGET